MTREARLVAYEDAPTVFSLFLVPGASIHDSDDGFEDLAHQENIEKYRNFKSVSNGPPLTFMIQWGSVGHVGRCFDEVVALGEATDGF
jgi:hypothetical protein